MGAPEDEHIFGVQLRESANDGSDFGNADADYRKVFLGEDGQLHAKDSAGTVTDIGGGSLTVEDEGTPLATAATSLDFVGAGVTASGTGATKTITIPGGGGGGLTLLEQHTASTSATLDFTSFIDAAYDTYLFDFVGLVNATNTVHLLMRMGTGGGPTWDAGNNYEYNSTYVSAGGSGVGGATAQAQIILDATAAGVNINNNAATNALFGQIKLWLPSSTTFHKAIQGEFNYKETTANVKLYTEVRGEYTSTTAVTGVRFLFSSGNITSGTIRVYGIPNS